MPISFLILTYNSEKYISDLIDSIYSLLSKKIDDEAIEIIIFDNASTDGTEKVIQSLEKNLIFKRSEKNLGYAKGINEASKIAKGEILVVINPDSTLQKFNDGDILKSFEQNPKLAVMGFKIDSFDNKRERNAGNFFNPLTFFIYSLGLESFTGLRFSPHKNRRVDFVSGGFVAFKKEYFDKLGGYDEDYFMYVEDMDICYRAKKMGLDVEFSDAASIKHLGQGSSNREFAIVNIYRGLVTFYSKNKPEQLLYIRSLLVMKAKLIIFLANIFGRRQLLQSYKSALQKIT